MMFVENTTEKDTISIGNEWKKNHCYSNYMFVAINYSLDDQSTYAKNFSSHHYEKKNLMEKMITKCCQICTPW